MEVSHLLIFILATAQASIQFQSERVEPGIGYSSDSEQIAKQKCYQFNHTIANPGLESNSFLQYVPPSEVAVILGYPLVHGGLFSSEPEAQYVREIMENDYSLSLNFYYTEERTVMVKIVGWGEENLNEFGKEVYQNGTNPAFGIICGDQFFESFQQGGLFLMNLKVEFNSAQDKEKLDPHFHSLFDALSKLSKSAKQYHYKALVTVRAYQLGGNTSLLPIGFGKDAFSCDTESIDSCLNAVHNAVEDLLAYFSHTFVPQLNNGGLKTLGMRLADFTPISSMGLNWKSQVNDDILRARRQLVFKMHENSYYKQKLHPYFHVPLDLFLLEKAKRLLDKVEKNIAILMEKSSGAATCWNSPSSCLDAKRKMDKKIRPITTKDLYLLNIIKYNSDYYELL